MFELFGVQNVNAQFKSIGLWTGTEGFHIPVIEKCERRRDLNGITLKSVVLDSSTYAIFNASLPSAWTGSAIEIVSLLEKKLNFR